MAATITYDRVAEGADIHGDLFAGKAFWVAQRVPSRNRLIDSIKNNGGTVRALEKHADHLIADDCRRDCPIGSISYRFVEDSIREGRLQDPANYPAGPPPGTSRDVGSVSRPTQGRRAPYTAEEDRLIYKWVHDSIIHGGQASGNAIYKDFAALHPSHPWQSWRDRYLKKLQYQPPSAFNVPGNAPPSPPSDVSVQPPRPRPAQVKKPQLSKASARPKVFNNLQQDGYAADYTVKHFDELFNETDWEKLYANVETIKSCPADDYVDGWEGVSKGSNRSAEQWRQYFEKVVLPQWRRDSVEKRQSVKESYEKRLAEGNRSEEGEAEEDEPDDSQENQNERHYAQGDQTDGAADPSTPSTTAAHKKRKQTDAEDAVEDTIPSSATAIQKTPQYISRVYHSAIEQVKGMWTGRAPDDREPVKRRRIASPDAQEHPAQIQQQIVEISSADTSAANSQQVSEDQDSVGEEPTKRTEQEEIDEDEDEEFDLTDLAAIPPPPGASEPAELSDPPSNSPTPRATRHKTTDFDTQAILGSPSQEASLSALPLPSRFTQLEGEEGDAEKQSLDALEVASDVSTTQSLQEFRLSVREKSPPLFSVPPEQNEPLEQSSVEPPSSPSSEVSEDPDPPLEPDELDAYFEEQNSKGFTDEFITAALKHTRWRPDLATEVLGAWMKQKPLPVKRGIWSQEDDEDVEYGDGVALTRLKQKHTKNGWGGITERLNFLGKLRSRGS